MKVIQIVTQMEAAGAQQVAALLHGEFSAAGVSSELVFLYTKRASHTGEGIRSLANRRPGPFGFLRVLFRLFKLLKREQPTGVVAHTHYANVIALPIAWLAGVPTRVAVQHNPSETYPKLARILDKVCGIVGAYSKIVAVCDTVVASMANYPRAYRDRIRRIYNGSHSTAGVQRDRARELWGLPADRVILLNVGRLSRQKNQAILLEALSHLPDLQLIIAGDGELRTALMEKARALAVEERVLFAGEVSREQIGQLLSLADLFVFPSLFEAMPMAIMEALNHGLPMVVSDIPAMRELVSDSALIVPAADAKLWSAGIRRLLEDDELKARLRSKGLSRAADFSVRSMADQYQELLYA